MKQIDVFGNEKPLDEINLDKPKGRKKQLTMQETYGELKGRICRDCAYLRCNHWNTKNYYKCTKWRVSRCSATDIRLSDTACKKFERG